MIRVTLDALSRKAGMSAPVDQASLDLEPGTRVVVLGPAGAGKSTLARLVAGIEAPDAGVIFLGERMANALSPLERGVGYIPEGLGLWPALSVARTVELPLRARSIKRAERRRRAGEALAALKLASVAGRRPGRLDPLDRVRLALARAIVTGPRMLVLDDPLQTLDRASREEYWDELSAVLKETGATTLLATSDATEAFAVGEKLAVMDQGRIVQTGPPRELYQSPQDVFVARLLGPTNLVQGQVEGAVGETTGELVVRTPIGRLIGRGRLPLPAPGSPVTISIRPETLSTAPGGPINMNRFPAVLERIDFRGSSCLLHARARGDAVVTLMPREWQARELKANANLTLSVAPEHVVILPGRFAVPGA